MKIKIQPDKQKAKSLIDMAKVTLERLNNTDKCKYPSNTLTDYYDIVRKLMEALASLEGVKIKGDGAHAELIDYISDKFKLGEPFKSFIQQMRTYRNRISYEGFSVKQDYIESNSQRIEEVIEELFKLVNEWLVK